MSDNTTSDRADIDLEAIFRATEAFDELSAIDSPEDYPIIRAQTAEDAVRNIRKTMAGRVDKRMTVYATDLLPPDVHEVVLDPHNTILSRAAYELLLSVSRDLGDPLDGPEH